MEHDTGITENGQALPPEDTAQQAQRQIEELDALTGGHTGCCGGQEGHVCCGRHHHEK